MKAGEWVRVSPFIEDNNIWYANANSTYNGCVKGTNDVFMYEDSNGKHYSNVGRVGARVLDNCVGFANGAYNETYVKNMQMENPLFKPKQYFKFTCNANGFIEKRVKSYYEHPAITDGLITFEEMKKLFIPPEGKPPVGGLVCWGGKANHVAYISGYDETTDTMTIIQSGYDTPIWTTRDDVNGGWVCNKVENIPRDFNLGGKLYKNIWWYNKSGDRLSSGKVCQGFIANPAVILDSPVAPLITSVTQESFDTITVMGDRNSDSDFIRRTEIYYSWDRELNISNSNGYDGVATTTKTDFTVTIEKPRDARSVYVQPVNVYKSNELAGDITFKQLKDSYPCVTILNSQGNKINAIPKIYIDGEWKVAIPTIRYSKNWYELYNTDKKGVGK